MMSVASCTSVVATMNRSAGSRERPISDTASTAILLVMGRSRMPVSSTRRRHADGSWIPTRRSAMSRSSAGVVLTEINMISSACEVQMSARHVPESREHEAERGVTRGRYFQSGQRQLS